MPINTNKLIFLDFETTGTEKAQPVSIGATIMDPRKYIPCEQGTFYSVINIIPDNEVEMYGLNPIDPKAMRVHGISMEEIQSAPPLKKVWADFVNWIKYHNPSGNKWDAPILCIQNYEFDFRISQSIQYGLHNGKRSLVNKPPTKKQAETMTGLELYNSLQWLKEPWGFGPTGSLFHPVIKIDVIQTLFEWFESARYPERFSQTAIKEYLGMPIDDAHHALRDAEDTAELFGRFIHLNRQMLPNIEWISKDDDN